jgi:protein-S-isoprenylcysteine O-methyltransferase Ste14
MKLPKSKDLAFAGIQLLLFVLYIKPLVNWSFEVHVILKMVSIAIAVMGILVIIVAILQLNKNLTPFPTPKENGELIESGLYQYVRHPIYSGIILTSLGVGFYDGNVWKISIGIALWILFFFKSRYEESQLIRKFSKYLAYQKRTRRFF